METLLTDEVDGNQNEAPYDAAHYSCRIVHDSHTCRRDTICQQPAS